MTYLPQAQYYMRNTVPTHIASIKLKTWEPKFVVLHNTDKPSVKDWLAYTPGQRKSWGDNLNIYYKQLGWHSGVHWACTPSGYTIELCDPTEDGISASCFNHLGAYGVEMIGNFENGGDQFNSGAGVETREEAINLLAALHNRFNWDPADYVYGVKGLHFHKECLADHHPCPGSLVDKNYIIARVKLRMQELKTQSQLSLSGPFSNVGMRETTPITLKIGTPTVVLPVWPPSGNPFFSLAARCFLRWQYWINSNPFILGMIANAEAESAFEVNALGDNDSAYGIYQWHGDRCAAIAKGCGIDITKFPTIEQQVDAAFWELKNLEQDAYNRIRNSSTAYDAAMNACIYYERAGAPLAAERRGAMGERWSIYFSKNPAKLNKGK